MKMTKNYTTQGKIMALITLQNVSIAYGGPGLLDNIDLQIEQGEKICLLGRNGEGKSTLIKLINGELNPDAGDIYREKGISIECLSQSVPKKTDFSVFEVVAEGLGKNGELLKEYHSLNTLLEKESSQVLLDKIDSVHHRLDVENGWQINRQVERLIGQMELNPADVFDKLSVGMKRRALLAKAIVSEPDLLLLDEPTNHLDIDAVAWLETFLARYSGTLFLVTHDRMFLQRIATRIVEIDRGKISSWACDYKTFLKRRQAMLDSEMAENALFDKKLEKEEAWIRQGIKARRTRNEGRVRALMKMRNERNRRRTQTGNVNIKINRAERTGKIVFEAKDLCFSYDQSPVINSFSTTLMRADRVGIIGPNGSGKTTLVKLFSGELQPAKGILKTGTGLEVAYFDQVREELNEDKSVQDNVADGNETVMVNGKPRHVISYLQDFLFMPDRARSPVRALSGGEKNRLMLARVFSRPSNVLILDEPTNDLDTETLELLEEMLLEYSGTVIIISHDRAFLDNVVTSVIVLEGDGKVGEYVGGYTDWQNYKKNNYEEKNEPVLQKEKIKPVKEKNIKLSFKQKKELESLPLKIDELEKEQQNLYQLMSDPEFYQKQGGEVADAKKRLEDSKNELSQCYEKWEFLDSLCN